MIARYDFGITRGAVVFPSTGFVTDSAGRLTAAARMPGQHRLRPMSVTVLESDLVLQTDTSDGVLARVFDKQAEGRDPHKVTGSWAVGRARGTLRARSAG